MVKPTDLGAQHTLIKKHTIMIGRRDAHQSRLEVPLEDLLCNNSKQHYKHYKGTKQFCYQMCLPT